jgi:hypothetical protein
MQYDDGKYMTEHKTDKIMRSTHLDRQRGNYIPWPVIVEEHNRKRRVIKTRSSGDESRFMGC